MTHADARFLRPVLTAMMVYVIGVGAVALLGIIAMGRAPAACPPQRVSPALYIVQTNVVQLPIVQMAAPADTRPGGSPSRRS